MTPFSFYRNKKAWTEEQEDELRQLYMENQSNPSTEQGIIFFPAGICAPAGMVLKVNTKDPFISIIYFSDVIDWMLDNMIERNRTRRAVIKKLKELGLIFKAPTRKSVAGALSKNAWYPDHDNRLRELYDQHRLDDDCLSHIMEEFMENRSRNAVIKRMIQLGLIADRSEVLPSKRKKSKSVPDGSDNDDSDESDSSEGSGSEADARRVKVTVKHVKNRNKASAPKSTTAAKRKIGKHSLNFAEVRQLVDELKESEEESLIWIQESLNDAAEDAEDASEDPDDGVPLVPFAAEQREALEKPKFLELLKALGFQEPVKDMVRNTLFNPTWLPIYS